MRLSHELRVLAVFLLLAGSSSAFAYDAKVVPPGASCVAYGPDTTAAELQFSQTGIYNPGTTIEKVLCQLVHDQEGAYASTDALQVRVDYRVLGGATGRVTCTLFIGTTSFQTDPVYTATASGPLVSGGNRSYLIVQGGTQQLNYNLVPSALICAISPKTSMGSLFFSEAGATEVTL
jgi:hypothetical protein